ncbi:MAG: hypothetical protein WA210_04750 [Burkholderiaceae bacterium]
MPTGCLAIVAQRRRFRIRLIEQSPRDKTMMVFGDAKKVVEDMVKAVVSE